MGIKPTFGNNVIRSKVAKFQENLEKATIFTLQYLGEELAKYAKEQHNYTDQTGNLTNSIGYAVVAKGKIVNYGGEIQPGEGAEQGLMVATKMAAELPQSFSLIIVAGMNYAAYVEAKGYNVILPAEIRARKDFPQAMSELKAKAQKKAQQLFNV